MSYAGDQLQSLDPNQPADNTQEATMPDFCAHPDLQHYWGGANVEHYRTGKHKRFFGGDTGAVNAYAITIPHIITAVDAGIEFIFVPTVTNTGASTLQITAANSVNLGTFTIKKGASNVAAGDIVAATAVQVIYDGTNLLLVNGSGALQVTASGGGITLLANQDGGFAEVTNTTSQTTLGAVTLPTNSSTKLRFDAEISLRNNTGNPQDYTLVIFFNANTRVTETIRVQGYGTSINTFRLPLSCVFSSVGTLTPLSVSVLVTMGAANANLGATLRSLRLYGID